MSNGYTGFGIGVPLPKMPDDIQLTATRRAVADAGEFLQQLWGKLARELVPSRTGDYINGIQSGDSLRYPFEGDDLAVGVFNTAPHAWIIEEGHAAFDLAKAIRWGSTLKSRRGKRGWYIIVPFRHYTPARSGEGATAGREAAAMPRSIYDIAKRMETGGRLTFKPGSVRTVVDRVLTPKGATTALHGHNSAGRPVTEVVSPALRKKHGAPTPRSAASVAADLDLARGGHGSPGSPWHATSKLEGITKTGAPGHTQYMSWRIITPNSRWIIPAQQGKHVAERVAEQGKTPVEAMIKAAFEADLNAMLALAAEG